MEQLVPTSQILKNGSLAVAWPTRFRRFFDPVLPRQTILVPHTQPNTFGLSLDSTFRVEDFVYWVGSGNMLHSNDVKTQPTGMPGMNQLSFDFGGMALHMLYGKTGVQFVASVEKAEPAVNVSLDEMFKQEMGERRKPSNLRNASYKNGRENLPDVAKGEMITRNMAHDLRGKIMGV